MDEQPRLKRSFLGPCLGLLGVCPLIIAFCATSSIPKERPIDGVKQLSPLAFHQYSVNLREIPATGRITVPFSFWNRSRQPLEIVKLEPSCGCLAPKLIGDRKLYVPGGQGLFEVQVDIAREKPGPQEYSVRVHYQDHGPREELVTFRLTVPQKSVQVSPPELYFYQVSQGKLESEIRVADHRGRTLNVVEVTASSANLMTEIQKPQESADGVIIPIRVAVQGRVPAGPNAASILIRTDDPDFPAVRVPVFLHGQPNGIQLTAGEIPVKETTSAQKTAEAVKEKEDKAGQPLNR